MPLDDAARIASWCHSGHCADSTSELPKLIAERRAAVADRITGLQALDSHLARLEHHLHRPRRELAMIGIGPCCDAADAVMGSGDGGCLCCVGAAGG